jgi:hypothetical protein
MMQTHTFWTVRTAALIPVLLAAAAVSAEPLDAQGRDACATLLSAVTTHTVHVSRGDRTIHLENRHCRLEARLRGEPTYTTDFRGIASLAPGGRFMLDERAGRSHRRLELVPDGQGGVSANYQINGERRDLDAAEEIWLADRLMLLYRRSGLAAAERADRIYRTGGMRALLAEAEHMHSSSGRAAFLIQALRQPELTDHDVARLLASSLPSSSSARTAILREVADRGPLRGETARAYLDAVAATTSSSRQRELLQHALRGGRAPTEFAIAALRTGSRISSSSARGELLRSVASDYRFDDALLAAYLDAASSISSSSWQREVLTAALGQEPTDAQRASILRAAGNISSSNARAEVLLQALDRPLGEEARSAYVDVAATISSSSHRARVLEALHRRHR